MTTARLADYSQVIKNYRIFNKGDVKIVLVPGNGPNVGSTVGYGFLAGAAFGVLTGLASGDDKPGFMSMTAEGKAMLGGLVFGAAGAVLGLIISPLSSTDDKIITINTDEDFYGLAKFLKSKKAYAQISQE